MKKCLDTFGANYTVVEALDATITHTTSTRAVTESHVNILKDALSKDYDDILVFEDDVDFDFSAGTLIPLIHKELPSDWEYVSLYCDVRYPCSGSDHSYHLQKILPSPSPMLYAVARALSRDGIQRILSTLPSLDHPLDVHEGSLIANQTLRAYMIKPPLILDQ
jgi:GR25 family glycosyltransferase involved in LPS biosynthesis